MIKLVSLAPYEISWGGEQMPPYEQLQPLWYQYLFQSELGPVVLEADRRGLSQHLWKTWSPGWTFTEAEFNQTADSFDNPDFVAIVLDAYREGTAGSAKNRANRTLEKLCRPFV